MDGHGHGHVRDTDRESTLRQNGVRGQQYGQARDGLVPVLAVTPPSPSGLQQRWRSQCPSVPTDSSDVLVLAHRQASSRNSQNSPTSRGTSPVSTPATGVYGTLLSSISAAIGLSPRS